MKKLSLLTIITIVGLIIASRIPYSVGVCLGLVMFYGISILLIMVKGERIERGCQI